MTEPHDPDARFVCDDCILQPGECGHEQEDCEQQVADNAAAWADLTRKARLEDGR